MFQKTLVTPFCYNKEMDEATIPKQEFDNRSVTIERAIPEDAETICDIRDRAWLEAYPSSEHGITDDDVKLMAQGPGSIFLENRIRYLKAYLDDDDHTTFVAKVHGKIVGFVDPRIDEQSRRRIGALYVAPETQDTGVGGKLMRHVLELYGRDQDIFLDVVSYNQNAINFYEHFGFEKTDAIVPGEVGRPDYLKSLPQTEMVLRAEK